MDFRPPAPPKNHRAGLGAQHLGGDSSGGRGGGSRNLRGEGGRAPERPEGPCDEKKWRQKSPFSKFGKFAHEILTVVVSKPPLFGWSLWLVADLPRKAKESRRRFLRSEESQLGSPKLQNVAPKRPKKNPKLKFLNSKSQKKSVNFQI